jgi:predicted phage terminase large subunit-like protein
MQQVKRISRSQLLQVVGFVDLAASTKTSADYSCIGTVGLTSEAEIIVINMVRGQWEWPETRRIIAQEAVRQRVKILGVESVAFQLAAVQELRRMPELVNVAIRDVHVDKDKVSRALPVAARAETGQMYLVRGTWNEAFIAEFTSFPLGPHDDQVDTISGAVSLLVQQVPFVPAVAGARPVVSSYVVR